MADAVAEHGAGRLVVADVLRWRKPLLRPDQGGPRFGLDLYHELVLVSRPVARAVLVDVLLTTSNHVRACWAFLANQGVEVVRAVYAGRTMLVPRAFDPIDEYF
jgi:hypothetical protein